MSAESAHPAGETGGESIDSLSRDLRRTRARLAALTSLHGHAAWVTARDGALREVLSGWDALVGLPLERAAGDGWLEPLAAPDRGRLREALRARRDTVELECDVTRADGAVRTVELRATPVHAPDEAEHEWAFVARDVTEERTRREVEAQLRAAVDTTQLGIWTYDLGADRVYSSPRMQHLAGFAPGEPHHRIEAWAARMHPDDVQTATAQLDHLLGEPVPLGETSYRAEYRYVLADGSHRWIEWHGRVLFDEVGMPRRIVGTALDLTERRRAAEERARLEAKMLHAQKLEGLGALAGGIAHDFNNLLVGILGNATFARAEVPAGSVAAEALDDLELTARRAADLARQLLAYSGKGRFVVAPVNVSALVGEMDAILRAAVHPGATLRIENPANLPAVEADATQLRQVVMNLVTNASDALAAKPGTITVRTGAAHASGDALRSPYLDEELPAGEYVFIEVSDTGVGMTPETASRIFDLFFTTKRAGHGLGLAATLAIVRGHRGTVRVYSEPGKGSVLKILLPASGAAPRASEPPSPRRARRATVLVVDDNESVARVAARILERAGYRVLVAHGGPQALDTVRGRPGEVDLVLLDLTMPVMSGEETFRALKSRAPELRVVLTSGYNEQDASREFVGRGLAGFVQKPYSADELLATVQRLLA